MKTYNKKTLKELKKEYNPIAVQYGKYEGFGDFGVVFTLSDGSKMFFADDMPLKDRYFKMKKYNYTGIVSNIDYSCEVFVKGESLGNTSKYRASVFLKLLKKGIKIDNTYLSSTRSIKDFLEPSEEANKKTEINKLVHAIFPDLTSHGHKIRNSIRKYAYKFGIEATKEKYNYEKL